MCCSTPLLDILEIDDGGKADGNCYVQEQKGLLASQALSGNVQLILNVMRKSLEIAVSDAVVVSASRGFAPMECAAEQTFQPSFLSPWAVIDT